MMVMLSSTGCKKSDHPSRTNHAQPQLNAKTLPVFTDITQHVGLDFVYENGAKGHLWDPEVMGSGVAFFDFDNDDDLDIYLTNGNNCLGQSGVCHGLSNQLYRNDQNRFIDVTEHSGLGDQGYGMGVAIGDIDNDGDCDVYVTNLGPDQLYQNNGDGTFENITQSAGIHVDGWSASAAFFDYDRDGFLDLYITKYVIWKSDRKCFSRSGYRDYCGPLSFTPDHDVLLHNNGDGTFTDVSKRAGILTTPYAGMGVVCADLNEDGWVDIYVTNDSYANFLWINQKDGTFQDEAVLMGVAYNINGFPEAGMGLVVADLDQDGDDDLFMTHLRAETNTIYRNEGPSIGFMDVSGEVGLGLSSLPFTGFGTAAFDVELDGDLDIIVVNGRVFLRKPYYDAQIPEPWHRLAEPNLFYLNEGAGKFKVVEESNFSLCKPIEISRGIAIGDIDHDGDIDVLISNIQSKTRLYRNDTKRRGNWLLVRAFDPRLNRDAIGARITVVCGDQRTTKTVMRTTGYLSCSDPRAHFGLGNVEGIDYVEIRWPDGTMERYHGIVMDRIVTIQYGSGEKIK